MIHAGWLADDDDWHAHYTVFSLQFSSGLQRGPDL
jgi:hypothetical protein